MGTAQLDHLFAPRSVGLLGGFAAPSPTTEVLLANLGRSPLDDIHVFDTDATDRPPALRPQLHWHSAWGPSAPSCDLLVSTLPIAATTDYLGRAAACGIQSLVVTQRETPAERTAQAVQQLRRTARAAGVRVLGPNSFGVIVPGAELTASLYEARPSSGRIALISQSGSLVSTILDMGQQREIGFSHVVSLGALADVDFGDVVDYLGWDPAVRCLLLHVENLADVRKFLSACRSTSRVKPIVAIKGGRSALGRELITKHTGHPAGEDRVYDTAFRRAGIIRVDTIRELLACGEALSRGPLPSGDRLAVVSNSGGIGVLVADLLALRGAQVAPLSAELVQRLQRFVAPYSGSLNPICIGSEADAARYVSVLEELQDSGEVDTVLVVMVLRKVSSPERVVEAMQQRTRRRRLQLMYVWHGNRKEHLDSARRLTEQGAAIYQSVEEASAAYSYARRYADNLANVVSVPPRFDHSLAYRRDRAQEQIGSLLAAGDTRPGSVERESLLVAYGVPVNPVREVTTVAQATAAARELGYPVTLQGPHGTSGSSSAWTEAELSAAYRQRSTAGTPVAVQRMLRDVRYELKVGVATDVEFGPYLYLGAGGPMAGVVSDPAVILPPLNRMLARRLIAKSGLADRLDWEANEAQQLEEILVRLSQLVVDHPTVHALEIDPLLLSRDGFTAQASRLLLADRGVAAPQHLATAPYPNQYEFTEQLKDGQAVRIRPIRPEDGESHYAFVRGLSPSTVYNRFFGFHKEISAEQMVRFTQIDYNREVAIVARVQTEAGEITIGVNRLTYDPRLERYEFAVVVADAWQGSGAGRLLMEKIVAIAADRGIDTIYGLILATNQPMLNLARHMGFESVARETDAIVVRRDRKGAPTG